jgi:hypothetical protein
MPRLRFHSSRISAIGRRKPGDDVFEGQGVLFTEGLALDSGTELDHDTNDRIDDPTAGPTPWM